MQLESGDGRLLVRLTSEHQSLVGEHRFRVHGVSRARRFRQRDYGRAAESLRIAPGRSPVPPGNNTYVSGIAKCDQYNCDGP